MASVSSNVELDVFPPIREIEIENFKSIKNLKLECKRVNIFIGEPNTGKSNIVEAIVGLPSLCYYRRYGSVDLFIRHKDYSNLFYDNNLDENIKIAFREYASRQDFTIKLYYSDGSYRFKVDPNLVPVITFLSSGRYEDFNKIAKDFKFYRFNKFAKFGNRRDTDFLLPPDGSNLFSIFLTHKSVKSICKEIFTRFGLKALIEPTSNELKLVKETEVLLIMYPYAVLSDTIQRLIFYLAVINTNKNSIITMEEPKAHAFPYYTKYLAELIAFIQGNQYFITTHNPYFLLTLIEKSRKEELAVYIT